MLLAAMRGAAPPVIPGRSFHERLEMTLPNHDPARSGLTHSKSGS